MAKPEDLLAAGAFLAVAEKLKSNVAVDTVSARVYRHPGLGNRAVVRLTADNLAEGDDLTMEFLGFAAPEVIGPVAKRQRQALGFPEWALINDPKHARYALELVKEFKKAVRKSKAKPGHGYDAFVEIAKRLGKSVAHFLPSFWEQVGREFIAFDNATYASRAFGKAREAEKVHALKVDESTRQDAFLEFALAGAVSIKALTEYGKELLTTHDPKSAWKFLRELCVRRTLGGMPPWTSMIKDLQPLLKAAKLDQEEEIHSILVEIIDSPAISRAAMGFWDSVSKSVGSLVKKNSHVAGVLLNMIPQTSNWRNNDLWPWLDHLDSWGILSNAWEDKVAEDAQPSGGTAAWLNRLIQKGQRLHQKIFDIIEAAAPRLRKDKEPVQPYSKARWGNRVDSDVDLLDQLLELNIPIEEPPENLSVNLGQWAALAETDKASKNRPRDPVHLVADSRFAPSVQRAVKEVVGQAVFEHVATGKQALRDARQKWLQSVIEKLSSGALPGTEDSLDTIESKVSRSMFEEFPEELQTFKAVDILPSITRTLQCGLMDEYGWPQLEKVFADFTASGHPAPTVFGQFPYLIVTDRLKAVVLRGNEIVHEAELKLPAGHKVKLLSYLDGDLLVSSGADYRGVSFWNSDPQPSDPEYMYFPTEVGGTVIDAGGGGTFVGEKIVHKGDKLKSAPQATDHVFGDGTHWWLRSFEYDAVQQESIGSIHEIDPVTGKKGRKSMPSFFEDFIQDSWTLRIANLSLLPFGTIFSQSLMGAKDGLIGYRQRQNKNHAIQLEGIDGRRIELDGDKGYDALLNQPETNKFLPVQPLTSYRNSNGYKFWDPTGTFEVADIKTGVGGYNRGQPTALPCIYLHAFEVRDEAASKKLRAVTDADVKRLMDAEATDTENFRAGKVAPAKSNSIIDKIRSGAPADAPARMTLSESEHFPLLDAAIETLLGNKSHPRLRVGLRGVIVRAGQKVRQLATLIEKRTCQKDAAAGTTSELAGQDALIDPFLTSISLRLRHVNGFSFLQSVNELARFYSGQNSTVHFSPQWFGVIKSLVEGVPQKLWRKFCEDPKNTNVAKFAEIWAESEIQKLGGSFRYFVGETTQSNFLAASVAALEQEYQALWPIPYAGKSSRFLLHRDYKSFSVLEYAPDGNFESIPDVNIIEESIIISSSALWSSDKLKSFARLAQSQSLNAPTQDVLKSVAERVHASIAEVALIWLGLPNFETYESNFMPTHLREACKLKTRECSAAKEAIKAMPKPMLDSLLRAVLDGDPADLWESPPTKVAERICDAWSGGKDRLPLPAEWLEKLAVAFGYGVDKHKIFNALDAPLQHSMFNNTAVWSLGKKPMDSRMGLHCSEEEGASFTEGTLRAATLSIAMLGYGLPVGDPARHKMCDIFQATLSALSNPKLLLQAGWQYYYDEKDPEAARKIVEGTLGKLQAQDTVQFADDGAIAAMVEGYQTLLVIRPSAMKDEASFDKARHQLIALTSQKNMDNPTPESHQALKLMQSLQLIRSADFAAFVERIRSTPVPEDAYEANPLYSAPDVVKAVAKKFKLSDDAAAYYLQLLTLADPTDKNVMLWNGWNSATIKKLAQELVDKNLVLEATRARAGRKVFLQGGWEDLKAPHLPLETWKMPLFHMTRDAYQRATPPLSRILPLEPVHTLFAKAWQRIIDGDVPKYEEVK